MGCTPHFKRPICESYFIVTYDGCQQASCCNEEIASLLADSCECVICEDTCTLAGHASRDTIYGE